MEKYLGNWQKREDIENDFCIKLEDDVNIIIAAYDTPDYSGEAYVLYEQKDKLYEVFGSHCSCFGLETQWEPTETTIQAIKFIYKNGGWDSFEAFFGESSKELRDVIGQFLRDCGGEPPNLN